jgi:Ca2+-binding RTX toxin-like protein
MRFSIKPIALAVLIASMLVAQIARADGVTLATPPPADLGLQLPGVTTGDASVVGPTSATLNGTVDPNSLATSFHFEYGENNVLDMRTPSVSVGAGLDPTKVGADLLGLQPGTSYSYRVVAESAAGSSTGPTQTFTTPAAGAGGSGGPGGGVVVSLSSGTPTLGAYVVGKSARCTITGSKRRDTLKGTRKKDVICGLGGNDRIRGLGGNDVVLGGPGKDKLIGGRGKDSLYGNAGRDNLRALDRKRGDRVYGGGGRDKAWINKGDRVKSVERVVRR